MYVHHLETGEIELVSRSSSGDPASLTANEPSISADGRYVAFRSFASNLDDEPGYIFVRDLVSGTTEAIPTALSNQAAGPAISGNGRYVFFHTGYTGRQVYDRQTGATTTVSIPATFATSWSRWSDDGRWLAVFIEDGLRSGTFRLWVWDRLTGTAREETRTDAGDTVTVGADAASTFGPPGISADGRIVGFWTAADGVVPGDTGGIRDVFVRDRGDLLGPTVTDVTADPASPSIGQSLAITATVDDAARGGSVVAAAELRVGTGEWTAMTAADGAFDEVTEIVEGEIPDGLLGGTTQVCVRGTDGQGNTSPPACLDVRVEDASAPVAVTVASVSVDGGAPFQPFARIDITPGEVAPDFNDPDYDSTVDASIRPDAEDDGDLFATYGEEILTGTGKAIAMVDAGFVAPTGQRARLDLNPLAGATQLVVSIDLATGEWSGVDGNGDEFRAPQSCISAADDPDDGALPGQVCLAVSTLSTTGDLDGDGLYDSWEVHGVSTDAAVDVELDLAGWGATPDHKDLFVQYDVSDDAAFGETVEHGLKQVQDAFALAPVDAGGTPNPDGQPGIRLWIDSPSADEALNLGVPTRGLVTAERVCSVADDAFYDVKSRVFDPNRRWVFRWGFKEANPGNVCSRGGQGELGGNDFLVLNHDQGGTFDDGTYWPGGETFMHELGHNLDLRHGGFENQNHKPNYLSIMNYRYLFTLSRPNGGVGFIDFSPVRDPQVPDQPPTRPSGLVLPVFEGALRQDLVLGAEHQADMSWADTSCNLAVAPVFDPFDLDPLAPGPEGPTSHPGFDADVDELPDACRSAAMAFPTVLEDHDDWSAIRLPIDARGDLGDAPTNPVDDDDLPTDEEIEALRAQVRTTDLGISAAGPAAPVTGSATVTLTVANQLGIPANAVSVTLGLPDGVTATGEGCTGLTCELGPLGGGDSAELELSVSGPAGEHELAFTVTDPGIIEADESDNAATATVIFAELDPTPSPSPTVDPTGDPTTDPTDDPTTTPSAGPTTAAPSTSPPAAPGGQLPVSGAAIGGLMALASGMVLAGLGLVRRRWATQNGG